MVAEMIIADACCNHLGDDRLINQMIDLCPTWGIKFQLFDVKELSPAWGADYEYYKSCQLSDLQVRNILKRCKGKVVPFFTVFTPTQLKRAIGLGVENIKIASPSAGDNPLCDMAYFDTEFFENGILVISTGMSSRAEIAQMLRKYPKATFLKCISRYPAVWTQEDKEDALSFDGISDHSCTIDTALWAVRNGLWVERHYTLGKDLPGKDHKISSTPEELAKIVAERDYLFKVDRFKTRWNDA
jgi:sialic acid synthase SpsE